MSRKWRRQANKEGTVTRCGIKLLKTVKFYFIMIIFIFTFTLLEYFSGHVIHHRPTAFLVVRNMQTIIMDV